MRIGRPAEPARTIDSRENAITPLRLGLALLVVFSHAFPIGGFGPDPLLATTGQMQLGTVAVIAFFAVSGFLLARSRLSSSLARYAARRAVRILPGLLVCVAVLAVIVIPLAGAAGGGATRDDVLRYVVSVATFQPLPPDIQGVYLGTGVPFIVDAPLWTLPWEVYLYATLALVGIGGARLMRTVCLALFLLFVVLNVAVHGTALELYGQLPVAFLTGACLFLHRVPLRRELAVGALAITVGSALAGVLASVGPVTIGYVALYLGMRLPLRWTFDMSFGVYIYGWPIASLLAQAGAFRLGLVPFLILTIVVVLPVAAVSARFVEMPALRSSRRSGWHRPWRFVTSQGGPS